MNNDASNPILTEDVTFIQHHLPGLNAGTYEIDLEQTLLDEDNNFINDGNKEQIGNTYRFAVIGDRFSIQTPTKVIYATYPAANATGYFNTNFPHVVFSKKTFPWMRYPTKKPQRGVEVMTDKDKPTWLAILTLDENDVTAWQAANPGNPDSFSLQPGTATIEDLFPKSLQNPNSNLGDRVSYFSDTPDAKLEPGQLQQDPIQTLDIPISVFWTIAPCLDDLNFLAHARKVSMLNKSDLKETDGEPVGDFSIVIGNRIPQTGMKTNAYLVSLEEMEDYLPDADGKPKTGMEHLKDKILRLAVLKNWTFYCVDQNDNFVANLQSLNNKGTDFTHLRLPYTGKDNKLASDAFGMGYIPLTHELRTGGQTVSWYRGPLSPQPVKEGRIQIPIMSPDEATLYDPTTGMFDVSYAMAWTLGRQLSLQAKGFSTGLYQWKRGVSNALIVQIEDQLITEAFKSVTDNDNLSQNIPTPRRAVRSLYYGLMNMIAKQNSKDE